MRLPASRRVFDICTLLLIAPFVAILTPLVALAVFLDSPGPILFRSRRAGYRGETFAMLKFRTMRSDGVGNSIASGNDFRVTPVGRFLRTTRLDELPQLWNVLQGEMSLVGPRPELEEFVALHPNDYREILSVPPGLTGPTQLRFAGREASLLSAQDDPDHYYRVCLLPDKVKADLEYAQSRSFVRDLVVLGRTLALPILLLRNGGAGRSRFARLSALTGATVLAFLLLFTLALGAPR